VTVDFVVYRRHMIEAALADDQPHVIISVTSEDGDVARLPIGPKTLGVLRLVFADRDCSYVPRIVEPPYPTRLFEEADAAAIVDLIERHRAELVRVIVHCDAGISRSPAIAAGIAVGLEQDDSHFFAKHAPNEYVYALLIAEWTKRTTFEAFVREAAQRHGVEVAHIQGRRFILTGDRTGSTS